MNNSEVNNNNNNNNTNNDEIDVIMNVQPVNPTLDSNYVNQINKDFETKKVTENIFGNNIDSNNSISDDTQTIEKEMLNNNNNNYDNYNSIHNNQLLLEEFNNNKSSISLKNIILLIISILNYLFIVPLVLKFGLGWLIFGALSGSKLKYYLVIAICLIFIIFSFIFLIKSIYNLVKNNFVLKTIFWICLGIYLVIVIINFSKGINNGREFINKNAYNSELIINNNISNLNIF